MRYDLAVIGGGSAGAALAGHAAARGLRVILLERGSLAEAGARWINDVPPWMFDEAGIARPEGEELYPSSRAAHLFAGFGPKRVTMRGFEVEGVDMRRLISRLLSLAAQAGAELRGNVRVQGFAASGRGLDTSAGVIEADFVADAAGLRGAGLVPRPAVPPRDLCVAAQETCRIRDVRAAHAFFERHGAAPDEGVSFLGVAGGFSTLGLRLVKDELFLLAGSIPAQGHASGGALLDEFAARHADWIGDPIFGGRRAIPLRHPFEQLAFGRVALLGDAAGQVFAGHGSGTGAGLIAARMLADALADGSGPQGYNVRWQRRWGALFAVADLFRRFSETGDASTIGRLMDAGFLTPESANAAAEQRWPEVAPSELPTVIRGAVRNRVLAVQLAVLVGRAAALRFHYSRYPEDPKRIAGWSRSLIRIMGGSLADSSVAEATSWLKRRRASLPQQADHVVPAADTSGT